MVDYHLVRTGRGDRIRLPRHPYGQVDGCRYIDIEDGSVILFLPRVLCGGRYVGYVFVCPKCAREFLSPRGALLHFRRCKVEDGLFRIDDPKHPKAAIAERVALMSKRHQRIDFPQFRRRWAGEDHQAFLLIEGERVVGYVCWRRLGREEGQLAGFWALWDFYVFPRFRHLGYGYRLFDASTRALGIREFAVNYPVTEDGQRFLERYCERIDGGLWRRR